MSEIEIPLKETARPMAVREAPVAPPAEAEVALPPESGDFDWKALRKVTDILERVNLGAWVAIMNNPRRSFWLNFWAGVARGIGMVVGGALTGLVFALFSVGLLKKAFMHAGGLPWVGGEIREAIGFILKVVHEYQGNP
ncbi:MAG TPA: DUF5665 domain-containing protein [bacterium]|jgi:hypothetical protein|nr:DUF5665 domain-containing protein [bacterium]